MAQHFDEEEIIEADVHAEVQDLVRSSGYNVRRSGYKKVGECKIRWGVADMPFGHASPHLAHHALVCVHGERALSVANVTEQSLQTHRLALACGCGADSCAWFSKQVRRGV
jgi:hypothetical protein